MNKKELARRIHRLEAARKPNPVDDWISHRAWKDIAKKVGGEILAILPTDEVPGTASIALIFGNNPKAQEIAPALRVGPQLRIFIDATKEKAKVAFVLFRGSRRAKQRYQPIRKPSDMRKHVEQFLDKKWPERKQDPIATALGLK
jgi:hypothetical protein